MKSLKARLIAILPPTVLSSLQRAKILSRLQLERFGPTQRRTNAMITVPGLARRPRIAGSVWGVCMARNEEDIIEHTVRHMLSQGLAGVIVVDNLSTDATRSVLDRVAADDHRVHVGTDRQVGFHQGGKVSYLSHLAWRAGADWVVPFDADEFWFAEGESVASFLARQTVDAVWCDFRNVYPTVSRRRIELGTPGPVQVERRESRWLRITFRARRWAFVGEGNHALRDSTETPVRGLHMLHFSYRSIEQYSRKVEHGVAALEAAGMDSSIATHWRYWASLNGEERQHLWARYLSDDGVGADGPIPPTERIIVDSPTRWRTWDPIGVFSPAEAGGS
ncbi:glycosyltransferase family 2 protein [Microbacterium atlanticum]|uniref:glycosyltransferase family 2 protein n=1 Tax=Microbacterium atlanticum TaxID=2782168 RepID=UPI001889B925|nr:glycosyltransferase family 2 protein [Microbacterium atlanticum]